MLDDGAERRDARPRSDEEFRSRQTVFFLLRGLPALSRLLLSLDLGEEASVCAMNDV